MRKLLSTVNILLLSLAVAPLSFGAVFDADDTVYRQGQISDDYYAAGGQVTIDAEVSGDLVVAGGTIALDSQVAGDMSAAGGSVSIRGSIGDDLRVAAGHLDIEASIGDDLIASGGDIDIKPGATVEGDTRLAAGNLRVAGTINGDLSAAAGNLVLSGRVLGNVDFIGDDIELLDGAVIEGTLTYRSPDELPINQNATVNGGIVHATLDWSHDDDDFGFIFPITMMLAAILFLVMFPNYSVDSARQLATAPVNSAGIGLLFLVFAPIVALLLMVIVVGIWVGLALLLLYAVSLLMGYLVGCIFVGDWGARLLKQDLSTRGRRIASVVLAVLLLTILAMVPLLGGLLAFIVLMSGLGAGLLQLHGRYRQAV